MGVHELFVFKPLPPLKLDKASEQRGAKAEPSDAQPSSSERRAWLSPSPTQSPVRSSVWRIEGAREAGANRSKCL